MVARNMRHSNEIKERTFLWKLIHARRLEEISKRIPEDNLNKHLANTQLQFNLHAIKPNAPMRAMISATEGASFPLMIFWTIGTTVMLGLAPLAVGTFGILALMAGVGKIYYDGTYSELENEINKLEKQIRFTTIKFMATNELLKRMNLPCIDSQNINPDISKYLPSIRREATELGLSVMVTALLTYYMGTTALLHAIGLSVIAGAMTGPVGLLIAFGVALSLGIYFGVRCYNYGKNYELARKKCDIIDDKIDEAKIQIQEKMPNVEKIHLQKSNYSESSHRLYKFKRSGIPFRRPHRSITALTAGN